MNSLKKILFISPNFPPVNAADMHRVRQLLFHFDKNRYSIDIISIRPEFVDAYSLDAQLLQNMLVNFNLHQVGAFQAWHTKRFGIGSLSLRSFLHFRNMGNKLIKKNRYDLIFFSTTATHLLYLGTYWKKKYKIPFVLDIQDPWVNEYYLSKPRHEQPPKYTFNLKIDKYLESKTIPEASAIISVSGKYNDYFKSKYKLSKDVILETIPFGVEESDFTFPISNDFNGFKSGKFNIVYVGRGGHDLQQSILVLFKSFKLGLLDHNFKFSKIHFYFIGTSYATKGNGVKTIEPLAINMGIGEFVTEIPDRVSYFESISLMKSADLLFIPGSTDERYTPSKLYPCLLTGKPILSISNKKSEMNELASKISLFSLFHFNDENMEEVLNKIANSILMHLNGDMIISDIPKSLIALFSAQSMTQKVFSVFENILSQQVK
jgi:hypothetical protein